MSVVSNAGPLIALARIERLDLLVAVYGEVVIPPTVYREVSHENLPGGAIVARAEWLQVRHVDNQTAVQRLRFWLDAGESEAIVLAQQLGSALLMDERRGGGIATALGRRVTDTIGTLIAAKQRGFVSSVTPLLDALITHGVRLSPRLYREAQKVADEA